VCAFAGAVVAIGCSSVRPEDQHAVRGQVQALSATPSSGGQSGKAAAVSPASPEGRRSALLAVLRGIELDFGTTLTPRQLASRLNAPARSSESLGAWVFEPPGSLFEIDANAMSMDSPIDWLRVTMRAELEIHLTDLTQLFSNEYDVSHGSAELVAVEFTSNRRRYIAAELRNDRATYISSAPVVSVQLRRPGYDPSVAKLVPPAH
jgi:hypothetical protein